MIEKLIHKRFGNTYNLFWNSYLKQLRPLDINEIVHWTAVSSVTTEGTKYTVNVKLKPPAFWEIGPNELVINDLIVFIQKCDIFGSTLLCSLFLL